MFFVIVLLFSVAFPILLFYLFGKPFERGFYCDDESLRYPFKESTITSTMLYIIGLGFPIATVRDSSAPAVNPLCRNSLDLSPAPCPN